MAKKLKRSDGFDKKKPIKLKIKKGDRVVVRSGRDKGKVGDVLQMLPKENRAIVSGVNQVSRHQRQTAQNEGGIVTKEASIHVSNLGLEDPANAGKPVRAGFKTLEDGRKVRFARGSGEVIDV